MAESFIQVTRSSMPPMDEYVAEIADLWDSHWLTNMGAKHMELEAKLKEFFGVEGVALLTNGHAAIEVVIEAMGLGADGRKKVITTPFTFASTTHAIVRKGLHPVFADIRRDNYTLDPELVEALIDEETCAIMPVHVYGTLCDVEAMEALSKKYGIPVIYDAAHAFGVEKNGRSSAAFGDASIFSFHATKVFNTVEGGAIAFHDKALYDLINQWKNFGIADPEHVRFAGGNAKMNEFCAAMGLCNLRHLAEEIAKRKAVAETYWARFDGVPGIEALQSEQGVNHNYAYLPVMFKEEFGATRDEVYDELARHGFGSRKYFYPLTNDFDCYRGRFDASATPVAHYVASRVLTLPMYADLSLEDVHAMCDVILSLAK